MHSNFLLIRCLAILSVLPCLSAYAQTPTPEQLDQIIRSQPTVDVSAPVKVTAAFDPPVVRPGERSFYRVTFEATEVSIQMPEIIPAPPPLKVQPSVSGQCTTATGGALRLVSTFNHHVQAAETGIFSIPEFTVKVYGRPVTVPAAKLEVWHDLPEPHEPARQLFVEAPATNVFVGETFKVTVRLPGTPASPVESIAQLQVNGSGFMTDKNSVRQSIQAVVKNGVSVPTYIYETSVTPITTGALNISAQGFSAGMQFSGPVTLTGQVSLPNGPPRYLLLESEPITVHVRPLPTENELPGFNGLIGRFTADPPSLITNKLKVGEPVQLTMIIRGAQNLSRINPPPPPRVPGWQIFPAVRGALIPGNGTSPPGASFNYTLIALSEELRATPEIPFSCFDPVRGQYVNLAMPSQPVSVAPDATLAKDATALMLAESSSDPTQKSGLSKLTSTPGRVANLVSLQQRALFPCFLLLPVLGFFGLWLWDRRRRFLEQHPEIVRRRQARRALRPEMRGLDQAAARGDAGQFVRHAISALQIVSAPHYPATPRALVGGDVLSVLTQPERDGKPGELVRRFFATADAAAFASRAGTQNELLAEQSALKELLAKLEARL